MAIGLEWAVYPIQNEMLNKSYLTAIVRNKISTPAKRLLELGKIKGSVLDFGCGRGDDIKFLSGLGFNIRGYDPYWKNETSVLNKRYDTILFLCI